MLVSLSRDYVFYHVIPPHVAGLRGQAGTVCLCHLLRERREEGGGRGAGRSVSSL